MQTETQLWPPEATQLMRLRPGPTRPLSSLPLLLLSGSTRGSALQGGQTEDPRTPTEVRGGAFTLPPGMGLSTFLPTSLTITKPIPGSSLFTC